MVYIICLSFNVLMILVGIMIQNTHQLPDCRSVTLYYCSYTGGEYPPDAIESPNPGYIVRVGKLRSDNFLFRDVNSNSTTADTKVLCSNHKSAFLWSPKDSGWNSSQSVNRIYKHVLDGKTLVVSYATSAIKNGIFLEMKCNLTDVERPPVGQYKNGSLFTWQPYDFKIPKNAVKAGKNERAKASFYIGLVNYLGKTHVVKIIKGSLWLHIVLKDGEVVYITSARKIKILVSDNRSNIYWEKVDNKTKSNKEGKGHYIYMCKPENEVQHYLTSNRSLCGEHVTFRLVYYKAINFV